MHRASLTKYLSEHHASFEASSKVVNTNTGYASEENYQGLKDKGIQVYLKYNYFYKKQKETKIGKTKHPFGADKLYYNTETDTYLQPNGTSNESYW